MDKWRGLCGFRFVTCLSPPSWPGIAVRRTASLPLAYVPATTNERLGRSRQHGSSRFDLRLQRILDDAIEGRRLRRRLVALLGDELVALCNQCREFLVQCVALL